MPNQSPISFRLFMTGIRLVSFQVCSFCFLCYYDKKLNSQLHSHSLESGSFTARGSFPIQQVQMRLQKIRSRTTNDLTFLLKAREHGYIS